MQDDLGLDLYDYKKRFYDQALGRFISVDPLASDFPWWTPYQFAGNRPTKFVDLDGMEPAYFDPQTQAIIPASDHIRHTPASDAQYLNVASREKIQASNEASKTAVSFMPLVGDAVDVADARRDFSEGNYGMGVLSAASLVPFADVVTKPLKALLKGGDEAVSVVKSVEKYEVGTFDDLTKRSAVGDGLDIHHVSQKQPASQLIDGYDKSKAPSIALPSGEHKQIPTIRGSNTAGSPRQQLAKDVWDLRQNTNAPNSSLQQLIDLSRQLFPNAFKK